MLHIAHLLELRLGHRAPRLVRVLVLASTAALVIGIALATR